MRLLQLGIFIGLALGVQVAEADTAGSMCKRVSTPSADTFFSSAGLGGVGLKNTSTDTPQVMTCPLHSLGGDIEYARVIISNQNASCWLQARSYNGSSFGAWAIDQRTNLGNGRWAYEFCVGAVNCGTSGDNLAIECTVPETVIIEGFDLQL